MTAIMFILAITTSARDYWYYHSRADVKVMEDWGGFWHGRALIHSAHVFTRFFLPNLFHVCLGGCSLIWHSLWVMEAH